MRILLIAYDFPPIPSPQSLRWAYLARELSYSGHEVHVVAPDIAGYGSGGLPALPPGLHVHRVYPGPLAFLFYRRPRQDESRPAPGTAGTTSIASNKRSFLEEVLLAILAPVRRFAMDDEHRLSNLNWKGIIVEHIKAIYSFFLFPDHRAEWSPWARIAVRRLLRHLQPDVIVTSHEPACSMPLGLMAKRAGYPWVADLGDPVLAPYTPPRWQARAHRLERIVCQQASLLSVTTPETVKLLAQRHGMPSDRCIVVPQGFDASFDETEVETPPFDSGHLELLYTGSLYSFRTLASLIAATTKCAGVRLNVATMQAPEYLQRAAERYPEKVRLLGFLPHRTALAAQRRCDVLINVANADPVQVPGKVHEYLQARRPILHLRGSQPDAVSELLDSLAIGWHVDAGTDALERRIEMLSRIKAGGKAFLSKPGWDQADRYSWQALAEKWSKAVMQSMQHTVRPS